MNKAQQAHFNSLYQAHLNALLLQGKAEATIDAYSRDQWGQSRMALS
jgi:integrase/recombinase XerD